MRKSGIRGKKIDGNTEFLTWKKKLQKELCINYRTEKNKEHGKKE